MRNLKLDETLKIGGGDLDGNAGEAEGRAFYEQYGVCNQDRGMITCEKGGEIVFVGNNWF